MVYVRREGGVWGWGWRVFKSFLFFVRRLLGLALLFRTVAFNGNFAVLRPAWFNKNAPAQQRTELGN